MAVQFKQRHKHRNVYFIDLPDTCLGEPRLIPNRRHSCVHKGVGLDELQGIVRELDGALKGCSWTVTCTAPGPRIESVHAQRDKGKRSTYTITHQKAIMAYDAFSVQ